VSVMTTTNRYGHNFYAGLGQGSNASASKVVPLIIKQLHPTSVLDVGCGLGGWLAEFSKTGCSVTGVDGSYVERALLKIPMDFFVSADLEQCVKNQCIPGVKVQHFSLCISLEVAEHIEHQLADSFVRLLTQYSDYVLFSAAIPYQGGTHHVNEHWPDYWITKFAAHNYLAKDIYRSLIWDDKAIDPWYRQNIMLFVKDGCDLPCQDRKEISMPTRVVHPDFYLRCVDYYNSKEHLRHQPSMLLIGELMDRVGQKVATFLKNPLQWSVRRLKNLVSR
jgi:SAM-dependent methyltransferase